MTQDDDCGLLAFAKSDSGPVVVSISHDWSLPTNVDEILDLAFGKSQIGKGVFVLYKVLDQFKRTDQIVQSLTSLTLGSGQNQDTL